MRSLSITILIAAIVAITAAGCTKSPDRCCGRDSDEYRYRTLWGHDDCRYRYWHDSRHREFFDPDDFGRGRDSLYGNPQRRPGGEYGRFHDDDCCRCRCDGHGHGWRHSREYGEDAVSERFVQQMAPDTEYDE